MTLSLAGILGGGFAVHRAHERSALWNPSSTASVAEKTFISDLRKAYEGAIGDGLLGTGIASPTDSQRNEAILKLRDLLRSHAVSPGDVPVYVMVENIEKSILELQDQPEQAELLIESYYYLTARSYESRKTFLTQIINSNVYTNVKAAAAKYMPGTESFVMDTGYGGISFQSSTYETFISDRLVLAKELLREFNERGTSEGGLYALKALGYLFGSDRISGSRNT